MATGTNQEALTNDYNDSIKLLSALPIISPLLASHKKLLQLISFHSSIYSGFIRNTFILRNL